MKSHHCCPSWKKSFFAAACKNLTVALGLVWNHLRSLKCGQRHCETIRPSAKSTHDPIVVYSMLCGKLSAKQVVALVSTRPLCRYPLLCSSRPITKTPAFAKKHTSQVPTVAFCKYTPALSGNRHFFQQRQRTRRISPTWPTAAIPASASLATRPATPDLLTTPSQRSAVVMAIGAQPDFARWLWWAAWTKLWGRMNVVLTHERSHWSMSSCDNEVFVSSCFCAGLSPASKTLFFV